MKLDAEFNDGNQPLKEGTVPGRFLIWLLRQLVGESDDLADFTDSLLNVFRPGYPVTHPTAGQWHATLDAIDPEDSQVAALVRLSRQRPPAPREPRTGIVTFGERGRELFAEPASVNGPGDMDLLLTFSFLLELPLEENISLFREFASNEIGRLRATSGEPRMA